MAVIAAKGAWEGGLPLVEALPKRRERKEGEEGGSPVERWDGDNMLIPKEEGGHHDN